MLKALVVTAPGINCNGELVQAFQLAGCEAEEVLLERLRRQPTLVDQYDLIGLPGGFSYGDDIAAGRIMAALMRREVYPALRAAIERGVPMICPCNGFQIAVQAGLLPGAASGRWPEAPATPVVALSRNTRARFEDRWTAVEIPANTVCVWTKDITLSTEDCALPCAHGEGRFTADRDTMRRLAANGQIALRYAAADNFNGSEGAVAGICDPSGLVFGLMPHPERWTRWTQHPQWTRTSERARAIEPMGLRMFRCAVEHVRKRLCVGARRA